MISQKLKRAVIDEYYKAPFDEMWPGLLFPAIADFGIDQIQEAVEVLLVEGALVSATHEFTTALWSRRHRSGGSRRSCWKPKIRKGALGQSERLCRLTSGGDSLCLSNSETQLFTSTRTCHV